MKEVNEKEEAYDKLLEELAKENIFGELDESEDR